MILLVGVAIAAISSGAQGLLSPSDGGTGGASRSDRTGRSKRKIENFDIRNDRQSNSLASLVERRATRDRSARLRVREEMRDAAEKFSGPGGLSEIAFDEKIGSAEIVSMPLGSRLLTAPSGAARPAIVRSFIASNSKLFGLAGDQIDKLKLVADYTNPSGNMSFVEFAQELGGIPVFQGSIRAGLTTDGEIIRTTGLLVPSLDASVTLQKDAGLLRSIQNSPQAAATSAAAAAVRGAREMGVELDAGSLVVKYVSPERDSVVFDRGPLSDDISLNLVYFPLETGAVTLSWSMTLWTDIPAYYTLIDAQSGELLWRKNITEDQTESATYSVYSGDSPAPLTPFTGQPVVPAVALGGLQADAVPRTGFTLISEHPSNNLGWLTDGATTTTGNNVDAGLDIASPNGIDPGGRPVSPTRNFVYLYNPSPGLALGVGSSDPADTDYRWGAVTNLFFVSNRYHDQLYELGFTEAARNFQQNNFGRNPGGGTANAINGNDLVRAEAQDYGGTNNANFSTAADGNPPRMQMYRWPSSNRDGDLDNEIVIHELTHGTSNRLHNNASGLGTTISRGMGEGWSDFYARALLSSADEDVNGIFTTGGYATHLATANYTNNYYYGIRRFPYAVKTNVGANGKPHNPLTFADTNPNFIDLADGAFARGPFGAGGRGGSLAVHNIGEVWSMALLEVRARIIARMGYAAGNQRMLQLVTDAMKLNPANPTLIAGRNSLLAADAAFGNEDVRDIWAGFATRGMGFGATMSTEFANGKESFDNPVPGMGAVTFTDCSANSIASPGETLTVSIPLTNTLPSAITNVTAAIGAASASYGTIAPGATVTRQVTYKVPSAALIGSTISLEIVVDSSLGQETKPFSVKVGGDPGSVTFSENFDGVSAPALPAGWTALVNPAGSPVWRTVNTSTQSTPNAAFVNFAATTTLSFLQSPFIPVTSPTAIISFRHSYNSEFEWDGAILQISLDGGTNYLDILDSGAGARMLDGGFNFKLLTSNDGNTNALQNRPAWTGNSGGFVTTRIQLPAAAAGQNVRFRWIAGADSAATVTNSGWTIDNIELIEGHTAQTSATTTVVNPVTGPYGSLVQLSATVAAGCLDPIGTLEFKVGGVSAGTVPVNGSGTFTLPYQTTQSPGQYAVTAEFTSGASFFENSAGAGVLTIVKANTQVGVTSAPNPSVFGQSVTFTANVSAIAPGAGTPTGTVTFSIDGTPYCVNVALNGSSQAQCVLAGPPALGTGNRSVSVQYSGDTNFNGSTGSHSHVVAKANTSTTVTSSPKPSTFGQSVTFTASVAPVAPGAGTPTGSVTFIIDGNAYCANTAINGSGQATCVQAGLPALSAGTRVVVASYSGDANFNGSMGSLPGGQLVNKANTVTVITNPPAPAAPEQNAPSLLLPAVQKVREAARVTWSVTPSPVYPASGVPTGTVTVSDGLDTCTASVSLGGCDYVPTTPGVKTLVATYNGDANFNTSVSAGVSHTVVIEIAGTVRQFNSGGPATGLAGVTVSLSGSASDVRTTGADGRYAFAVLVNNGTFTVTPSGLGKVYDPISRTHAGVANNIAGSDFTAYNSLAEAQRKLRVVNRYVVPGQSTSVPVMLESQGNETKVSLSIGYDVNPFVVPPTVACGADAGANCVLTIVPGTGSVGITVVPQNGTFAAGAREVVTLTFNTLQTQLSNTPINIVPNPTSVSVRNAANDPLLVETINGFVVFRQGLEGDFASRNTGDGVLLANDVTLIRQLTVGLVSADLSFNEFQRADTAPSGTKGDGVLNATDVIQTRRYILGLDPVTSAGGPFTANAGPAAPEMLRAGDGDGREIRAASSDGLAGNTVTVPVEMTARGDETAFSFTLNYDAMKLGKPTVTLASGGPADAVLTVNDTEDGRITVLVDSATAFPEGMSTILNVTFDIAVSAAFGETGLTFSGDRSVSDAKANELQAKYTAGTIMINGANAPGITISGRVLTPEGQGVRNAQVTIIDVNGMPRTVTTTAFGYYSFEGLARGSYTVRAASKRYRFASRTIEAADSLGDVDLLAHE